jgi:transcriptional regulator with XRE-family HTH domain
MAYKGVPTVRKRLLGGQLRRLREERDISIEEVARKLGVGHSTVRRQESGHTAVSVADALAYATIYDLEDDKLRGRLIALAKHGRARGWWTAYGSKVGPTAVDVADAEDLATEVRTFQPLAVPGIFQTTDYSAAIIEAQKVIRPADSPLPVDDLLTLRERRKEVLQRRNPPQVWAVIGEAVIRTQVGGPEVMAAQVEHLVELGQRNNVTLQLLPFTGGAHVGMNGGFMLLSFGDTLDGSITYVESGGPNAFNDEPNEVRVSANRFTQLQSQALSTADTQTYLRHAISDI